MSISPVLADLHRHLALDPDGECGACKIILQKLAERPAPPDDLRALSEAATQGEWRAWGEVEDQWGHPMPRISYGDGTGAVFTIAVVSSWDKRVENRDFIVAAVNDVRARLAAE